MQNPGLPAYKNLLLFLHFLLHPASLTRVTLLVTIQPAVIVSVSVIQRGRRRRRRKRREGRGRGRGEGEEEELFTTTDC